MLKLLGSLCVLTAGGWALAQRRREFRQELDALRRLSAALEAMADNIRLERPPMPRLLDRAGSGQEDPASSFFRTAAAALRRGEPLPAAWRDAAGALPLPPRDRQTVADLGRILGGDEVQACKGLQLASSVLRGSYEELERCRPQRERQRTALCFSAAALVIILLL